MLFRDLCGRSSTLGRDRNVTLRPCLEPRTAARSGSECRAHLVAPVTAHAPHRLPFLFFVEHRLNIAQVLAICRSSPFNGRGGTLSNLDVSDHRSFQLLHQACERCDIRVALHRRARTLSPSFRDAFKTYYEGAEMGEEVDPSRLYQIKGEQALSPIPEQAMNFD